MKKATIHFLYLYSGVPVSQYVDVTAPSVGVIETYRSNYHKELSLIADRGKVKSFIVSSNFDCNG